MNIKRKIAAVLGGLLLSLGVAYAGNQPLKDQQVAGFIASLPDVITLGEQHADNQLRDIDPRQPLASSLEIMDKKSPAYTDLAQLVSRHGFANVEQWANVGDRTITAYGIVASGLSNSQVEAGYQQGVVNIKKDAALNDNKKAIILKNMEKTHARNMLARKAAEPDLAAVQPYLKELDKLFD